MTPKQLCEELGGGWVPILAERKSSLKDGNVIAGKYMGRAAAGKYKKPPRYPEDKEDRYVLEVYERREGYTAYIQIESQLFGASSKSGAKDALSKVIYAFNKNLDKMKEFHRTLSGEI